MRHLVRLIAGLAVAVLPCAVQAQDPSTLVVVIKGESVYHQPSCPLIVKAGANVTMMKLSEATAKGLSAHDCEAAAVAQPKKDANAVQVFVQPGDRRYHKAGCKKLTPSATPVPLGEAGKKYWPCAVCKPPIRQREKALG